MKKKRVFLCIFLFLEMHLEAGIVITSPGITKLPSLEGSGGDLITIAVDDVILNLTRAIVSGGARAIVINPNLSNITIQNGKLENNAIAISISEGCSRIKVQDTEIVNCSDRAIEILGMSGNEISTVAIENIQCEHCCTSTSADFIISMSHANNVSIIGSTMNNNGVSEIDLIGINIDTCTKCIFNDVRLEQNLAQTFTGIAINSSMCCHFVNCHLLTNNSINAFTGFVLTGSIDTKGNLLTGCQVRNNTSTNGPFSGFELLEFVIRNELQGCTASNNLVTGAVASANLFAFNFDQPTYCHLIGCNASNNQTTGDGTTNICVGFNIGTSGGGFTGTKDCEFLENFAFKNNGFNDARSFGIRPVSLMGGNVNNSYLKNTGLRNGPSIPVSENQIIADSGTGSNPGGVPFGSVRSASINALGSIADELSNTRIT